MDFSKIQRLGWKAPTETSDFCQIVVERHHAKTAIMTSNREPAEWLTVTADTLLAQSAADRLTSNLT